MPSATDFLPCDITELMNFVTSWELYSGSGRISRLATTRRLGIFLGLRALGAVLGTSLLAVGHADRIERSANHVVANSRQVLDAPAADHDDRVLLEIVSDARNVGRDLDPVGQAHARDLAQRGVGLLRRRRVDARAHAALLRRTLQRGRSGLHRQALAALPDELRNCRHRLS